MGKKAVGKNRRRHARENATVAAVLDGVAQAGAEERAIGVAVNAKAPDAALFTVDRGGLNKEELTQELRAKTKASLKEKRLSNLRSEAGLDNKSRKGAVPITVPGRKKRKQVGSVDLGLLEKRTFKRNTKKPAQRNGFNHDVWDTSLATEMSKSKSENRKRIESKCNAKFRSAVSLLKPDDGMSVNPAFVAHQDALGEAVAGLMDKKFSEQLVRKQLAYDKNVIRELERRETMDVGEEDVASEVETELVRKLMPERKSRFERNRERRRREADNNKRRKIERTRMRYDLDNLEKIAQEAIREADKLNGETKKRDLETNPPVKCGDDAPLLKHVAMERVRTEKHAKTVPLSDDLAPNMRGLAMPVGNSLIKERYLSFERRGFVEPPTVLKKEAKQAERERRANMFREKKRKNKRGSASNISYWRQGGKKR